MKLVSSTQESNQGCNRHFVENFNPLRRRKNRTVQARNCPCNSRYVKTFTKTSRLYWNRRCSLLHTVRWVLTWLWLTGRSGGWLLRKSSRERSGPNCPGHITCCFSRSRRRRPAFCTWTRPLTAAQVGTNSRHDLQQDALKRPVVFPYVGENNWNWKWGLKKVKSWNWSDQLQNWRKPWFPLRRF